MNLIENWSAFRQGHEASQKFNSDPSKVKNPYPEETKKFYGWNQGWNSHKDKIMELSVDDKKIASVKESETIKLED